MQRIGHICSRHDRDLSCCFIDFDGLLEDLQLPVAGNLGLIKAVERFDPAKGGKLSTYAAWWIKQSIKRALANQSKTIRLPVHLVDKISKMIPGGPGVTLTDAKKDSPQLAELVRSDETVARITEVLESGAWVPDQDPP